VTLAQGQRVTIIAEPYYGMTGTLVRRTRLIGKTAWVVALDVPASKRFAIKRERIVESALVPEREGHGVLADPTTRRAASAQFAFAVTVPLVGAAWLALPPVLAGAVTAVEGVLAAVWLTNRRRHRS
jgi:hypothetical protein